MSFAVVADNLRRTSEIKSLKLENKEYAVTMFYYGDYEEDFGKGTCDVEKLSMSCKPKGDGIPLTFMAGIIVLSVPAISVLPIYELQDFKRQLENAEKAAVELQGILKEYFKGLETK